MTTFSIASPLGDLARILLFTMFFVGVPYWCTEYKAKTLSSLQPTVSKKNTKTARDSRPLDIWKIQSSLNLLNPENLSECDFFVVARIVFYIPIIV